VQGDAGHPGYQGGGPEKNNRKKWRAEEEERHKGLLTQKNTIWALFSQTHLATRITTRIARFFLPKWENISKWPTNIPNGYKIYQFAVKYTKWP
jgi:hypothetical protein